MKGSIWRKWDLHVHTPGTKLNDKFIDSKGKNHLNSEEDLIWKEYCEKLNESGISCFGITDYFSVENFLKLRKYRIKWGLNTDIKLFPNIELRLAGLIAAGSDKKLYKHVNVHVIFPEDIDDVKLRVFLSNLEVKGENGQVLNFKDNIHELISSGKVSNLPSVDIFKQALIKTFGNDYKNKCIIMIPNGDDGLAKTDGNGHQANVNFMKEEVDIIQSINSKDREFHLNKCEELYCKRYPCVGGSDAHDFERFDEYEKEKSTWIKADTNFNGLKTILIEPEDRVIIQADNPDSKLSSKVIDYITLPEEEFGGEKIYFNSGMNTIIGGRSSGKSLLISLLAKKTGNVTKVKRNDTNYEKLIEEKATLTKVFMKDGSESNGKTIIEFFYQDHLQEIASSIDKKNNFLKEIIGENKSAQLLKDKLNEKTKFLLEYIVKLRDECQVEETLSNNLSKIQSSEQLQRNINEIESDLNFKFKRNSDDENNQLEQIKSEIQNLETLISNTRMQIQNYKTIQDTNFYVLNPIFLLHQETIFNEVNQLFVQRLEALNDEIRKHANEIINIKKSEMENNIKQKENLITHDIYKNYIQGLEATPRIQELENQKLTLTKRQKLEVEVNESVERIKELKKDILNRINYKSLLIDEIILDKASVKLSLKSSINMDKLFEIFHSTFKINFKIFKDLAAGDFKEISNWKDTSRLYTFSNLENDFSDTIGAILNSNENAMYKNGKNIFTFISELSNFTFINQDYEIQYKNSDFIKMSEGKKAFVLLLIKLEIGEENCPLLIDQPEDDLDNRAIVRELVAYLKKQKQKRQVFIVTHNANIVVASDSENVIIANEHDHENPNPSGVKYFYESGSLENEKIKGKVCNILEGGEPAFKQRESRYNFGK